MLIFYFIFYNLIFFPLFYLFSHLVGIFHPKLRKGVLGRYLNYRLIKKSGVLEKQASRIVVHCASMGEFEHIKPFLKELRIAKPETQIIVLFFSPSGFENIKNVAFIDLILYAPFDWILPVARLIKKLKPSVWIIAKHDVWPNQVWIARLFKIPVFLINASLHKGSSRLHPLTRNFHKNIYGFFHTILTISESDKSNFKMLARDADIIIAGDTKYDQVILRREESRLKSIIPSQFLKDSWVFVAGSTWPEDEQYILPVILELGKQYANLVTIICPHEPTKPHIQQIISKIDSENYTLLSEIEQYQSQKIIIIDRVGVLANIYSLANCAYVGGSFKQNIHNVLEPAVYHIPVLFGPVNQNSHEAQLLKQQNAALEISGADDLKMNLINMIENEDIRQKNRGKSG